MANSQTHVRLCFEVEPFKADTYSFQVHSSMNTSRVELLGNSTLNDVSLLIGSLLNFNELPFNSKFVDALYKKEELALVGGLLFEQNNLTIAASCCADFQDWKVVASDIKREASPWMGHNPTPWFDFDADKIIVWSDEDDRKNSYAIELTQQEFAEQLEIAKQQMQGFLKIAEVWTIENYHTDPSKLVEGMRHYLFSDYS